MIRAVESDCRRLASILFVVAWCACGNARDTTRPSVPSAARGSVIQLSIVGTSDLHGHIEWLPLLDAYVDVIRGQRDGVALVDAGDMFQGTVVSNLSEGAAVVNVYGAMGYTVVAIGNHEFDFGVVGDAVLKTDPDQDAQGALRARAAEAKFPFLTANIAHEQSSQLLAGPNISASTLRDVGGVKVGFIGVSTESLPSVTLAENFEGLQVVPTAESIERHAVALRNKGAAVVVVAAHAGGECHDFSDSLATGSCQQGEIFDIAREIRPNLVDVIVAGHTHQAIADNVNGIAVVQSYAYGKAFGRVDLTVANREVIAKNIHPPHLLCSNVTARVEDCKPWLYEGVAIVPSPDIDDIVKRAQHAVAEIALEPLGVSSVARVERSHKQESALGNLFADLMLEAQPQADVAIINGGGLRADLPKGRLTYGDMFEALPFDNTFVKLTLSADMFAQLMANALARGEGFVSVAGVTVTARCEPELTVTLRDRSDKVISPDRKLVVALSNFLASGGDNFLAGLRIPKAAFVYEHGQTIRDAMIDVLRRRGGRIDPRDFFGPRPPRVVFPGSYPVTCQSSTLVSGE